MDISAGLARVFSDWGGAGTLFDALGSVEDGAREWSPSDIRRRAVRVLVMENVRLLADFPQTYASWMEWLPISTRRSGSWSSTLRGRPDWKRTAIRKWPPDNVYVRRKHRVADNLPASVLAWAYERVNLATTPNEHGPLPPLVDRALLAMGQVVVEIEGVDTSEPTEAELNSLHELGGPWPAVSALALRLKRFEKSGAAEYARRLIEPELADRLFQLEVLGEAILGLESAGKKTVSLRPIGGATGPVYASEDGAWTIWWEASSIWNFLSVSNIRQEISADAFSTGMRRYAAKPDRPDVLVMGPKLEMLVVECKYPLDSQSRGYVSSGVSQAYFYGKQLAQVCTRVHAIAVGPESLVKALSSKDMAGITVGIASERHVSDFVRSFVSDSFCRGQ